MLTHLIRKEILEHILTRRFAVVAALTAGLVWLALWQGIGAYEERLADYQAAKQATEERIRQLENPDDTILSSRNYTDDLIYEGHLIHKPPAPLGIVAVGLEPILGRSMQMDFKTERRIMRSPSAEDPLTDVFDTVDLSVIVQVALGLFALLITYDAISGEKEAATLRLLASYSVSRSALIAAKLIGALVPLILAFILPVLVGGAAIVVLPDVQLGPRDGYGLLWILAACMCYLATMTAAGLLGSALCHRASTSFVVLLAYWLVTAIVLPRLSPIVVGQFAVPPSISAREAERRATRQNFLDAWDRDIRQWQSEYENKHGQGHWETAEGSVAFHLARDSTARIHSPAMEATYARLDESFRNEYNAWLVLAQSLARLSPSFSIHQAIVRLAGTGIHGHQDFEGAAATFLIRYQKWMSDWFLEGVLKRVHPEKYGEWSWRITNIPRFDYRHRRTGEDTAAALFDVGIAMLWGILFFAGANAAFNRYDVR